MSQLADRLAQQASHRHNTANQVQSGASPALQRAVVTDNTDEQGLQRHTTTTSDKAGQVNRALASRVLSAPFWDPPQYPIGSTASLGAYGTDGHNLACMGIEFNQANPTFSKEDPVRDDSRWIPGKSVLVVGGDEIHQVEGEITVLCGGSRVHIAPSGSVTIESGTIALSAPEISLEGKVTIRGSLQVLGQARVQGKEVALSPGARDTGGDTLITSGQG